METKTSKGREIKMAKTTPDQNKTMVLEMFDTLFNKRNYATAERFWSPNYIQHSAHISPGRESVRSHQKHPTNVEVRTGNDRG